MKIKYKWIDVKEKLPKYGIYIVCLKNKTVTEMTFSDLRSGPHWFKPGICEENKDNKVTHWAYFPKAPK